MYAVGVDCHLVSDFRLHPVSAKYCPIAVLHTTGLRGIPTQALPPAQVEALNRVVKQRSTSINVSAG
jgi:hypothetical protein